MIRAEATFSSPAVTWTLESTDAETGYKIVKNREGVVTEQSYPDKETAEAAWQTLNEEIIQPGYTP